MVMRIATSSPRTIELCPDTGFFRQIGLSWYGMKIQVPAPQGPGLGWQQPSVNAMMELGEQLSSRPWMIERDSFDKKLEFFSFQFQNLNALAHVCAS